MKRSDVVEFLKTRSLLVSLLTVVPFVVLVLGLAACVKHPVGDPEKSKVDPQYVGVWSGQDKNGDRRLLILPRTMPGRTSSASGSIVAKGPASKPRNVRSSKAG